MSYRGNLTYASVEFGEKDWRTDRMLRDSEVATSQYDEDHAFIISGTGDVGVEPGEKNSAMFWPSDPARPYALSGSARARRAITICDAHDIVKECRNDDRRGHRHLRRSTIGH